MNSNGEATRKRRWPIGSSVWFQLMPGAEAGISILEFHDWER
jgi:hypothetical protein